MPEPLAFFATTAKGMEDLLAAELRELGAHDVQVQRAGVSLSGTLDVAYRVCLWSRVANRVLLPLATFPAPHRYRYNESMSHHARIRFPFLCLRRPP